MTGRHVMNEFIYQLLFHLVNIVSGDGKKKKKENGPPGVIPYLYLPQDSASRRFAVPGQAQEKIHM